ncbi:MAG TPA: hypothetical protein VFV94_10705, partial [Polyangiaceae bacterium]|nr:hypothetical protein [Polyangiaceae bacterium]
LGPNPAPAPPEPPPEDDGISGLFERATPVPGSEAPQRAPESEPPPAVITGPPTSSNKRPARRTSRTPRPSRPASERPARRPSSPPQQPAIELDLELEAQPPVPAPEPDALEMELPLPNARISSGAPGPSSNDPEVVAMKDRYATGDFSGALIVAEGILEAEPQHEEARRCRERCTDVLSQMYLARLGSLAQIVQVALSGDEIRWLSLDHRAGFLLSLIDGASSIETLLDISGMARLEALRILYGLLDQRVIALSEGR